MKRRVFGLFLGAGASCEIGMPLVTTLTEEFKKFFSPSRLKSFNAGWKIQGGGYDEQVINHAIQLLEDQDLNYENILGNLQTRAKQKNNLFSEQYYGLYLKMLEILYGHLYTYQLNTTIGLDQKLSNFIGLKNFCKQSNTIWAFSLNHDIVFEQIAEYCGLILHDGFWPENPIKIPISDTPYFLYADILTEQDLNSGKLNLLTKTDDTGINLIKLHGALDVFTFRDGHDLCRLKAVNDHPLGKNIALKLANEGLRFEDANGKFNVTNEITYTDENGVAQFLRKTLLSGAQKYNSRYSQTLPQKMIEIFRSYLNYVTDLFIVGYSFGDFHVDAIIRSWLEFSSERTITIVGPDPKIPYYLIHLRPQIFIVDKKASEFFKTYE